MEKKESESERVRKITDLLATAAIPQVQPAVTNERGSSKRLTKLTDVEREELGKALAQATEALANQPLPEIGETSDEP